MKRVYTLYRVSTKKQVDLVKDDIPMQRIECREFAKRQGWEIVKELEEKGVSGFKVSASDRDAIQDLKDAAQKKKFDVFLVYMFDRIGRIDDETSFVVEWLLSQNEKTTVRWFFHFAFRCGLGQRYCFAAPSRLLTGSEPSAPGG